MLSSRRFLVTAAVTLSLALHLLLLYLFTDIRVGGFAIPADHGSMAPPLHLKRVEIPAATLEQAPPVPVTPPPQGTEEPPTRLPEATQITSGLAGAPPQIDAPTAIPGSAAAFEPVVPAPPTAASPYSLNDRAKISAEIAKLAIGPVTPGLAGPSPSLPSAPGASLDAGNVVAGQNGTGDLPTASVLPSISQVRAQFLTPPPTLNPNLPQPVVLALPTDILFDFDSSQLRPGAGPTLGQARDYIAKYIRADVEVDGHTDSFGAEDYNQKLSLARAQTVQVWLQQNLPGADFTIQAKGFGDTRPVVSTKGTVAEQQPNRRVEIVLRAIAPPSGAP